MFSAKLSCYMTANTCCIVTDDQKLDFYKSNIISAMIQLSKCYLLLFPFVFSGLTADVSVLVCGADLLLVLTKSKVGRSSLLTLQQSIHSCLNFFGVSLRAFLGTGLNNPHPTMNNTYNIKPNC